MIDIKLPKLNNNDTSYVLVEWLAEDGAQVEAEQPLVVIETSKAQEEIESSADGILHTLLKSGQACCPGQVIAHLFASVEEREEFLQAGAAAAAEPEPTGSDLVVTKGAQALVAEHGLTDAQLRSLGRTVIRRADLAGLLEQSAEAPAGQPLPQWQQAVGAVVNESMRTIPAAAAYAKVDVEEALALAQQLAARDGGFVSLGELLVKAVAQQHAVHPLFFSELLDDGSVRMADTPDVGVTVDVGKGLFVPVVRDAASLSSTRIAALMMEFRVKALRGSFRANELAGANIMIALHNVEGLVIATPIIFPGQTCVVSLGGTEQQLVLDEDGRPVVRRYVYLGLVYDHRVVNGRDAMAFLQGLKSALESPATLVGADG
ncbi:2-oxo acid dehydrogenase subunit E2 [Streptomyces tanashiensis]|uniref:2-oxo acid dehydrogenase subunit E2 n=1 Tax=Streptomyces tanashiensis TaxID=67367 RepID=UPI0033DFD1A1